MTAMTVRDTIIFAGQGSASLFLNGLSDDVRDFVVTSVQANNFLLGCFKAFKSEIYDLKSSEKALLGENVLSAFSTPLSLANPPKSLISNPIIQNTSLYIHQILGYLHYIATNREQSLIIEEATGFCSGLIPATVVAASFVDSDGEVHRNIVEGFRLVFWIGLRVAQYCKTQGHVLPDDPPWSIVASGLELSEISQLISRYNQTEKPELPICIASVLTDRKFSLTAHGRSLQRFKTNYLPQSISSRSANVHGYYHGGTTISKIILNCIVEDVCRRDIGFPDWKDVGIPIRSTLHGGYMTFKESQSSLLETILSAMFMQRVEWHTMSISLVQRAEEMLCSDASLTYRIVGIETNSKSLLSNMKSSTYPRLAVINSTDLSRKHLSPDDIAIIGMGMKFPSGDGSTQFWNTIGDGLNVVTEIPVTRFNINDYYDVEAQRGESTRKTRSRYGNFIDNPFDFDHSFFQISPREAKSMDPQQRILLHTALDALEDAGYSPNSSPTFQKENMGVFVGVATLDYADNSRDNIDVYYSTGTLRAFLSGRISYAFGFGGPSVVVDTACSSSVVAIYQACRSLQNKDCMSALAGGVNVISSPEMQIGLSRAHFLSDTGQCKPFDALADGYCRAEGCGVFVLKRAVDAVSEGDRIHGIIRGVEVNQCGSAKSITHPDAAAQEKLYKKLLSRSGIPSESITVVEAHGTGTQAGDYAEMKSIRSLFGSNRKPGNPLYVSSVKGNIGHAEAASGAAALAKLLLMMRKQQIPPQAAHYSLNPRLGDLSAHNIVIPRELTSWDCPSNLPRRALLNNFGAAGSNAALILEDFSQLPLSRSPIVRSSYLLNISAKTAEALESLCRRFHNFVLTSKNLIFEDFCYSASARKIEHDAFRLSIGADCMESALKELKNAKAPESCYVNQKNMVVFVFSGQGSIYQGMGSELLRTAPAFRRVVRECDGILENLGYSKTEQCLVKECHVLDNPALAENSVVAQCACFVLEYALAKLWISFGVIPDIAVGHSLGEYAMLAVAGAVPLREVLSLVAKRAELMLRLCETGKTGMMACHLSSSKIESLLATNCELYPGLTISCKNSPCDSVIAGPSKSLSKFHHDCKVLGIKAKLLEVPYGFHSSAMDPILEPFHESALSITSQPPEFAVVSSTLGKILSKEDLNAATFVKHAREAVDFATALEVVETFAAEKELLFLEIGPAPKTLPMVKATLNSKAECLIPSLRPSEEPWVTMNAALRVLYLQRHAIQWNEVFRGSGTRFLDLPRYPLSPSTSVIPYEEPKGNNQLIGLKGIGEPVFNFPFLKGSCVPQSDGSHTYHTDTSLLADYIKSHAVGGVPLCPASVYMELAAEASVLASANITGPLNVFRNISFSRPLVYQDGNHANVFTMRNPTTGAFSVSSGAGDLHCIGSLEQVQTEDFSAVFLRESAAIKRQLESVAFVETFSTRVIYSVIFPRVVQYSDPFLTIKKLHIAASGLEGFGTFRISSLNQNLFHISPPRIDTLLHAAGFVANIKVRADQACICVSVEEAVVPSESSLPNQQEMTVYCSLNDGIKGYLIGDAYALDAEKNVRVAVRGMHFKILSLKAFQAQLARTIGSSTYSACKKSNLKNLPPMHKSVDTYSSAPTDVASSRWQPTIAALATGSRDANLRVLQKILSELCQSGRIIDQSARLEDLGMDSLLFIEMEKNLVEEFPTLKGAAEKLESCSTVLDLCNVIQSSLAYGSKSGSLTPGLDPTHNPALSSQTTSGIRTPANSKTLNVGPTIEDLRNFLDHTCGFSVTEFDKRCTLDSLGVDSLLSIEIEHGLRQNFGMNIDMEDNAISSKTVEDLERLIVDATPISYQVYPIESRLYPTSSMVTKKVLDNSSALIDHQAIQDSNKTPCLNITNCVTLLQRNESSKLVLYMFHDGSGMSSIYSRISELPCNVVGISSIDFDHINKDIKSLEHFASECIARAKLMESESFILGGWSFGGVLAFEVSRQLRAQGKKPRGVILIDSPSPVEHEPLPDSIIEQVASKIASRTPYTKRLRSCIEAQFKRNARLLGKYVPVTDSEHVQCVMLQCTEIIDTVALYGVEYLWLGDEKFRKKGIRDWEQLIKKEIPVYSVKGNHFNLFTPGNVRIDPRTRTR